MLLSGGSNAALTHVTGDSMRTSRPRASDHTDGARQRTRPLEIVPRATTGDDVGGAGEAVEAQLLSEECEVLADVVPVPLSIAPAMRDAFDRAMRRRFELADDLDDWIHSPFEPLVRGDGLAVLRAVLGLYWTGAKEKRASVATRSPRASPGSPAHTH